MASIRKTKKEVAYLINEVISNSYMAIYFQPESQTEALSEIVKKAVDLFNDTISQINHPAEKHNPRLVKKHYAAVRANVMSSVDGMFDEISKICQQA